MKILRWVQIADTHTAGEPTRIVLGELPYTIPGRTMGERQTWLADHAEDLRQFLLQEPRGHNDMFGAVVVPPVNPEADFGLIFFDSEGCLGMCGHGTIGAVTALASLGWTQKEELIIDTPAGEVRCRIHWKDGEVVAVTFQNVASFYLTTLRKDGVPIHIAYGGNLFALVEVKLLGFQLERDALPELVHRGMAIRRWVNEHHVFHHPATRAPLKVDLVEFYSEAAPQTNVAVFGEGQVDRSPCGSGTCAKMAFLHAHGQLGVGEEYRYRSILGTEFIGRIVTEVRVGDILGIIPEVTGSAYLVGIGSLVLVEGDPFPSGFRLIPQSKEDSPFCSERRKGKG
ncbi:proline racemase family protein [Dehalococcoidia bacterium]|nr:proline racemase family protein [Dehalococcoidia bacterium]